jgi:TPR repeat protein
MDRVRRRRVWIAFAAAVAVAALVAGRGAPPAWPVRPEPPGLSPPTASSRTKSAEPPVGAAPSAPTPVEFVRRLRCTQYRPLLSGQVPEEVLTLLCQGRPLEAARVLVSLADAGDERAWSALGVLGNAGGTCDPPRPSAAGVEALLRRAQDVGASAETRSRLAALLAADQAGPGADATEACRRSAAAFARLQPSILRAFVGTLGRSYQALRGEDSSDVEIEFERKRLVPGDAAARLKLASALQQRGRPADQPEVESLLREAAATLPAAQTELAKCLLAGCPNPAPDPAEAHELLIDAARAGDQLALVILSGASSLTRLVDEGLESRPEVYAWSRVRKALEDEGCFGAAAYVAWVPFPQSQPDTMALSPADAALAEARTAELLASAVPAARARLGCD